MESKKFETKECIICKKPFLKYVKGERKNNPIRGKYVRQSNSETCSRECSIKYNREKRK
jgi:hypothetical protein